ncbi:MAG: hypothetical protein ACPGWR_13440 [Ardenticatenaceae bacterium]
MADQKQDPSSTNIIPLPSRHDKNFEHYITDYAVTNNLTMDGDVWESALAAAKRLDYAKREGRAASTPDMTLIPAQPSLFGRFLGLFGRRPQEAHLSELDDIRAFLAQAPEAAAQQSQINWGILRNGFGSWMKARLLPGGQQKGSSPTPRRLRDTPGWELLSKRKLLNGRTLYVRGHLLHDAAGGAGVDYNLAPLTGASRGDFGANHANFAHRYAVEGVILGALANMHGQNATITQIDYDVIADKNRPPRAQTAELEKITRAYEKAASRARSKSVAQGGSGGAEPTHQHVMNELALNTPSAHLNDAMLAVEAEPAENWDEVHGRMIENLELWKFEDQNVPIALDITFSWVNNGKATQPRQIRVDVILPNSLAARYE